MDPQKYNEILNYLQNGTIPTNLPQTNDPVKSFKNFCNNFQLQNNYLYKIDKRRKGNLLRVIRKFEMDPVLYMMHHDPTSGHFAAESMFNKIRDRYYWPQMFEDIRTYAQSCDACQRRGKSKKTQYLHPIPVHGPFFQMGIDFVGPLPVTAQGNRYIIVAMDYLTKWPEARPVPQATAEMTASFIYEEIICRHGCPSRILTDRGTHFNNKMISRLMDRFTIKHLLSSPYHPQTNGLVERFNRTLCEALAKLVTQSKDWDKYIAPVLFAYRTSKQATTKITPFYLAYGREARLPIDDLTEDFATIQQRIMGLVDDLPILREIAKETITESQSDQKQRYDRRILQETTFDIGDKVLYYKAALDNQRSGKFDEKWKGPYHIHNKGPHGTYQLRDVKGKISKSYINGNFLKIYREREI
jgi:Integrase zinc binding domain/Integrase core domain